MANYIYSTSGKVRKGKSKKELKYFLNKKNSSRCLLRLCLLLFHKISIQPSPKLFSLKALTGDLKGQKSSDDVSENEFLET